MNILIKNGTIITSEEEINADIFISEGKIKKIDQHLEIEDSIDRIIDAKGKLIFPGGIDPHVHMHLPTPAGYSADNFESGSKAAVYGGTTTIVDFVTPRKGQRLTEALNERKLEAESSVCDYSFHMTPVEWNQNTVKEIKECIAKGITSFKVYMAYKNAIGLDDNDIIKVMDVVAKCGGIVTLHCELGDDIEELRNNYAKEGKTSPEFHPLSRPPRTEAEAVKVAIEMAKKSSCPIYIVHTSSGESIKYIEEAQKDGHKIYSETCPQYLLLDDSKYIGKFDDTAKYVMSPPLRKKKDQEILWDALQKGVTHTIGTDHCPFNMIQKKEGKDDFRMIPNGAGGVEHRMKLLYTHGVLENKISLQQFVDITATQAAKIFGLFPQKGTIAVGSDADIIVWDPKSENVISVKDHYQNCDLEAYEGFKTIGEPEMVIKNGIVIVENSKLALNTEGRFLRRK